MTSQHHADPVSLPDGEPGVKHETRDANIRTIVFVGCTLVASAVVIHVGIWGLFQYWEQRDERTKKSNLPLVVQEKNQLPAPPRLEAFEPARARVTFETTEGKEQVFYVDTDITVERVSKEGRKTPVPSLFALPPNTPASLTYTEPQYQPGRNRVLRIEVGEGRGQDMGQPVENGLVTILGTLTRIEALSGLDKREEAETRLGRYGWVEEKKQVVHIPIEEAMKLVLDRHLLEPAPAREKKAEPKTPEAGGEKP
jgi:hypothetical protein